MCHLSKNNDKILISMDTKCYFRKQSVYLMIYDLLIALFSAFFFLYLYLYKVNQHNISQLSLFIHTMLFLLCAYAARILAKVYNQVWRYAAAQSYIRLITADLIALLVFYVVDRIIPIKEISLSNCVALFAVNTLLSLSARIIYRYCFLCSNDATTLGRMLGNALLLFSFGRVKPNETKDIKKIPVAILGAGKIGVGLANDFVNNKNSIYEPNMFLENDNQKVGRVINGISIFSENIGKPIFEKYGIKEVIFTVDMPLEKKQELYKRYKEYGLSIKTYELPVIESENAKKVIREFDIEELLFRKQVLVVDDNTEKYYKNKIVLITGGGGSIGSEMARQIAKMEPKQLVLLDIYENGVYDIEQELKLSYKDSLKMNVEICSVCDYSSLEKVYKKHKPQIVIHAAAHKHVPLMENNVCEAIYNNVFGTLNAVKLSEKYAVQRFIMVSTDKAVNPTNVMGATKRMCEMIVKTYSNKKSKTTYSMTRFGNVLGSAGSVIPMFKRQIKAGGPITITDKRIIRYFMTIPEASQLVLKSGAMAKNGELFVLDMGKPVKILDLANNLIRLSGLEPGKDIKIKEIGLRPGEKLYEELLVKSETLTETSDSLIFIENDAALSMKQLNAKLSLLDKAVKNKDDIKAKKVLKKVVPTFKDPKEVNKNI